MNGQQMGQALRSGQRVTGTCIVSTSPQWPTMIAQTGIDFVFIDTEHVPIERNQLAWMCRTYTALGLAPIVRIPSPNPYLACQVLDAGATGVIAPYLETVAEVRQLRGATKLRPLKGERLSKVLEEQEVLAPGMKSYLEEFNQNRLCILNIESTPALAALDEILTVPDLDALLIGPHDLSVSLGVPEQYEHPDFRQAVTTIIQKGRAAGVGVGIHWSEGISELVSWAREGLNLIIHSSDFRLVEEALTADIRHFRAELGDTPVVTPTPAETNHSGTI